MEDKWFVFLEGHHLFLHRSWTGHCIFDVRLERAEDGWRTGECWINADPAQCNWTDAAYEAQLLDYLIDRLLLGKTVSMPFPRDLSAEDRALYRHGVAGYERANDQTR